MQILLATFYHFAIFQEGVGEEGVGACAHDDDDVEDRDVDVEDCDDDV